MTAAARPCGCWLGQPASPTCPVHGNGVAAPLHVEYTRSHGATITTRVNEPLLARVREAKERGRRAAIEALREEIERTWSVECSMWNAGRILGLVQAAEWKAARGEK